MSNEILQATPATPATSEITQNEKLPGYPRFTSADIGDGQITFYFDPPIDEGKDMPPIKNYVIDLLDDDSKVISEGVASGPTNPLTVTGLKNGTSYRFAIYAVNDAGNGPYTIFGNFVPEVPSLPPDQPTSTVAVAGDSHVIVSFLPPDYSGSKPIIGYYVNTYDADGNYISSTGGITFNMYDYQGRYDEYNNYIPPKYGPIDIPVAIGSPIIVNNLKNGTGYYFFPVAVNEVGISNEGENSEIVVCFAIPCYTKGAQFITPNGNINVENLKKGDLIKCEDEHFYEIKNMYVMPKYSISEVTEFKKDSLYPNVPNHDLVLSQAHFVKHDGKAQTAKSISSKFNHSAYVYIYYHIHVDADVRVQYAIVNNMLTDVWGNQHPYIHKYAKFIQ
jgi:hypothetical protein